MSERDDSRWADAHDAAERRLKQLGLRPDEIDPKEWRELMREEEEMIQEEEEGRLR